MKAHVDEESVIKANAQFWEQMLMMTLAPVATADQFCVGAGHALGYVNLNGNWKGRIEVRMTGGLAQQATAAMLMMPIESVADADTLDATKEIANMIAGTIKSSLPRPCSMTVPESAFEADLYCEQQVKEDSIAVAFRHDTGELLVRIHEEECIC